MSVPEDADQGAVEEEFPRNTTEPQKIRIRLLVVDEQMYRRAKLTQSVVKDFARAMREGEEFPPIEVACDPKQKFYWVTDGRYRVEAAREVLGDLGEIDCIVKFVASKEEAQWASLGANRANSLRRTNPDKRMAVQFALKHFGEKYGAREIAKQVGVDHKMVCRWRKELCNPVVWQSPTRSVPPDVSSILVRAEKQLMKIAGCECKIHFEEREGSTLAMLSVVLPNQQELAQAA